MTDVEVPSAAVHPPRVQQAKVVAGVPLTRQLTRGPLDDAADDPLADTTTTTTTTTSPPTAQSPARVLSPTRSARPLSPHHGGLARALDDIDMPPKDFSFLQDGTAYHLLPATSLPPPFLNAPHLPAASSPIDALLLSGHYRLAAIAAARNIVTAASPEDHATLLHLLHVRLACLCLINEHALAAQESKVLGDLNSAFYRHPLTNAHLVPWHLRLLVVRLAALGYGEWRKGIMGYYELARECRENIVRTTTSEEETKLWRTRLRDCGIRVANVLVEMGDLEGAGRHLGTLSTSSDDAADADQTREVLLMETLVWLRVGDVASARRCLSRAGASHPLVDGTLKALILLADADYEAAATAFRALHDEFPADAMVQQNLAVTLLYTGRIAEARQILTSLADASPPFHAMVFNLSTVYELCTERNRDRKLELAAKLAARKGGDGVGWELSTAEFKL